MKHGMDSPTLTSPRSDAEDPITLSSGDALLVVDVQNDFLPGGALAVPDGDAVVGPLNRCIAKFVAKKLPVALSRDWHPLKHCSFRPQGGPWPPHCVADTDGARFATGLHIPRGAIIASKATSIDADAYSAFEGTGLADGFRARNIRRLFVGGLATEYCVEASVRNALAYGFQVVLLADAMRPIDPPAGQRAMTDLRHLGVQVAKTENLT